MTIAEREELKRLVAEAKLNTQYDISGIWESKVRSRGPRWDTKIVKLKRRDRTHNLSASEGGETKTGTEEVAEGGIQIS